MASGEVTNILNMARERIIPFENWCLGPDTWTLGAINGNSEPVEADSPDAVRWCAIGSMGSFVKKGTPLYEDCMRYLWLGTKECHEMTNLHQESHEMVLSVYDRAIRMATKANA